MNRWIPYAFVRIVLFFMLGISTAIFFPDIMDGLLARVIFVSCCFVYAIIAVILWRKTFRRNATSLKIFAGIVGLSAIFIAGFIRVGSNTQTNNKDHIIHYHSSIEFFKVITTTVSVQKTNSWKAEGMVEEMMIDGKWESATGKIMLYLSKQDFPKGIEYGDALLIRGYPQSVPGPSNPEEFDYQRFLAFKNIYHQKFVRKNDVIRIGSSHPGLIEYYALKTRHWADSTIKHHVAGHREKALASALVLGVTDGLDNELLSAYKATGTLHVLAVSGLHVGILYGIIILILTPLKKIRSGPWMIAVISIALLWAYAFVTGLSPSVLRAVTMFSFVAIAKPGGHRTNIYNTLATSAFIILWYDPFFIMSVGFQLSYIAVLGIVYMQPGLYNLFNPTNRVLDEIWKISSVSIAAQIATFSIGLLYFHQFPNYFLVSNLVAIPGSFIVLVLGLATLATSFVFTIAYALGCLLELVIKAMNAIMFILEDLPFSLIENVYITASQCWLLIGFVLAILMLIRSKKFVWVKVAFFLGMVFTGMEWYHFKSNVDIRKITVYNITGHTAVDLIDNAQVYCIVDSVLGSQPEKINFHIASNRIKNGAKKIYNKYELQRRRDGCSLIVWNKTSLLRIYDKIYSLPDNLQVDYLIISNDAVTNIDKLLQQLQVKKVILDSSNSKYKASALIRERKNIATEVYSVAHQGALEFRI